MEIRGTGERWQWGTRSDGLGETDRFGIKGEEAIPFISFSFSKLISGFASSQLQTNLIASGISPDGRWLVVSDLYETKLFRLVSVSLISLTLALIL